MVVVLFLAAGAASIHDRNIGAFASEIIRLFMP